MLVDLGETGAKHSHGTLEAVQQSRGNLGTERIVVPTGRRPAGLEEGEGVLVSKTGVY